MVLPLADTWTSKHGLLVLRRLADQCLMTKWLMVFSKQIQDGFDRGENLTGAAIVQEFLVCVTKTHRAFVHFLFPLCSTCRPTIPRDTQARPPKRTNPLASLPKSDG